MGNTQSSPSKSSQAGREPRGEAPPGTELTSRTEQGAKRLLPDSHPRSSQLLLCLPTDSVTG